MAETTKRLPLAHAVKIADWIADRLAPGCDRIQVAGSIRRKKPDVGDIELVAIPKRQVDLLGCESDSLLDPILDHLCFKRMLVKIKGGDRYKQFHVPEKNYVRDGVGRFICRLDLFLVTPETWGVQLAIRTGPAEFSHRLVTATTIGGHCPPHLRFREGRVWEGETALDTPQEEDVFRALGLGWMEPEKRGGGQ